MAGKIKAISIWQPYASLIIKGFKLNETRGFPINYRGPLVIHAAKKPVSQVLKTLPEETVAKMRELLGDLEDLPTGKVLGTVRVVDCVALDEDNIETLPETERMFGIYEPGRYAWCFGQKDRLELAFPQIVRGRQGLWGWDPAQIVVDPSDGS